jgi:hypothetical protein
MLTTKEFEILINNSESSTLDFKATMYDFSEDKDFVKTGKFVKDVLSFCNTIRNETSYIIIGVQENEMQKTFLGLNDKVDDAMLQDKVKDKVFPRPNFTFYVINYDNKVFGIFEFPVTKYSTPVYPTVKMKGLEIGRIYYRRGTTNTEAIGHEVITINNWLQGLPDLQDGDSVQEQVNDLIKRLTTATERLSTVLADILLLGRRYKLTELISFCSTEIKGIEKGQLENRQDEFQYRVQTIKVSLNNVEINPHSYYAKESFIKSEMEKSEDFFDFRMLFPHPISEIESYMDRFNPETICMTMKLNSRQLFPEKSGSDYKVIGYAFKDNYLGLYRSIRQKTIDKLMEV